jgi:arabinan endo-1,5-alpha-L-arabinosidase
MNSPRFLSLVGFAFLSLSALAQPPPSGLLRTDQIQIRDPFVVPVAAEHAYYLFGTTDKDCWKGPGVGFDAYRSTDLVNWEGPIPAFRPPPDFWADRNFWAPEVHRYGDAWYLFASFKSPTASRGTQILKSDKPAGPYRLHSDGPVTPRDWEGLDGTLFVDDHGAPWMVFSHEWVQVNDGEICALPLAADLRKAAGAPVLLFKASSAPWSAAIRDVKAHVTDGPFLYRSSKGPLLMLWSTVGATGYTMGFAVSPSGSLLGPWQQAPEPLFNKDGGHGMIFRTLDGQLMLTLHQPNQTPNERARFFPIVEDAKGLLRLAEPKP